MKNFIDKNPISEENFNPLVKEYLGILSQAVDKNESKKITYKYRENRESFEARALKIIFSDDNVYLAAEIHGKIRLLRLAFIEKIEEGKEKFYPPEILENYEEAFENMQNAMTLLDQPFKTAILRANSFIGFYFEEGMKKFFPSQKYIKTNEDGSVDFSLNYTQALEILPFIKKWLPSIEILEADDLKAILKKDLETALKKLEN